MSLIRVYINKKIKKGFLDLDNPQTHYLNNVMRLKTGDSLNIFNENDGEWEANVSSAKKNSFTIKIQNYIGIQPKPADIWVLFAPVKSLRVDFISQKITELGASLIWPILTERTQVRKIKSSKIISN
ncbi:MAG: RsmE family RNA methyltransferase, partial [Pseudomonadota bacterium]|nr:RsmE family RNA methyltransferase [Pseudomonadota bacterium]